MTQTPHRSVRSGLSRRRFVQGSALGAAGIAGGALALHPGVAASAVEPRAIPYVGAGSTAPVRPFRLTDVALGNGLLQEKRDRMKAWLRQYDERRFLVLFNEQAGRPNPPGVAVPGGWENGGLLSGHWAGHYLTALAQAYADGGEQVFRDKLDFLVTELAACQAAITERIGGGGGGGPAPEPVIVRVPGRFGQALRLNGPSDAEYLRLPQEAVSQLQDFTIATWVNLGSQQSWSRVFDFGSGTSVNMFLTPRASGGMPRFAITTGGSGAEQQVNGTTAVPVGSWAHLAVTLSGGTGTLYVNGAPAGTNPSMTLKPTDLGVPGNVWIGRSQYGDPLLDAAIDEFHIFDRALSPTEIASLQETAGGTPGGGNIASYRFEEASGASAEDSSPNGRDAGIVAAVEEDPADWEPTHPGYLGAIPEDAVIRLGPPRFAVYGGNLDANVWAPWYTQHKIMRGLLDTYTLTGNETARDVVVKMADWAHLALTVGDKNHPDYEGPITRDDLNFMWDTYIAGEYGGANEVFPEIHALTGDERHLETAKLFDNRESLFDACKDDRDILVVTDPSSYGRRRPARLHANQHVPNFTGYLRIYEQSGERDYHRVASNFYGMVVPHRMFANAGTSGNYPGSNNNVEMFQNRDNIANAIGAGGAESCTTYNLVKLASNLFYHQPDPTYMEYVERAVFNHVAGTRADSDSVSNPQLTYFQPLTPGVGKSYGNTGTCCGGSGLESHTKYQETAFAWSADGGTLWVNQYIPSTLTWVEKDVVVRQETSFPRVPSSRLVIERGGRFDLKLRVPQWATRGFRVKVNGHPAGPAKPKPSSYATIRRSWRAGDTVEISMPFTVRVERATDRPDTQAVFWGPLLMPILGDPGDAGAYRELTLYRHLKLDGDYGRAAIVGAGRSAAGDPLLTTHGLQLRPWYVGDTQAHSAYFRRVEPTIVFGRQDSGVPNYKRDDDLPRYDVPVDGIESPGDDGLTFLDVVWDQAPFGHHVAFVHAVVKTADRFVKAGLMTEQEKERVHDAALASRKELSV